MSEHAEHEAKLALCKLIDGPLWLVVGKMLEKELAMDMLAAPSTAAREDISKEYHLLNRFCSRLIEIANSVRGDPNG